MKKLLSVLALLVVVAALAAASGTPESSMAKGQAAKENTMNQLIRAVPVPELKNAQERMMIARRALMFDKPHVVGYVYIFVAGTSTPLGYYVIDGKVASLKSYLVPQQRITDEAVIQGQLMHVSGYYVVDDADIDGTYGDNIDGVFFFTDNGVYVEIPTNGPVGYTYSTQPLPIRVPKLTVQFAVPDKQ